MSDASLKFQFLCLTITDSISLGAKGISWWPRTSMIMRCDDYIAAKRFLAPETRYRQLQTVIGQGDLGLPSFMITLHLTFIWGGTFVSMIS